MSQQYWFIVDVDLNPVEGAFYLSERKAIAVNDEVYHNYIVVSKWINFAKE